MRDAEAVHVSGGGIGEVLAADQQGERWLQLSDEMLFRCAEIRQIEQGSQVTQKLDYGEVTRYVTWPCRSLIINNQVKVDFPLWTLPELLAEIGAEVIRTPRTKEEIMREPGQMIPPTAEGPPTQPI